MKRFYAIPTCDVQEGMCLYQDILDQSGNLLLPKDTRMTAAMVKSLLRRNIETLLVLNESVTDEQLAAERSRVKTRLAHLCRLTGSGRANALLRTVVEQYRMRELS